MENARTILFVDSSHAARKVLSEFLRNNGFTVLEASDLPEAILAAKDYSGPIDVLIAEATGGATVAARLGEKSPHMRTIFVGSPAERAAVGRQLASKNAVFLVRPLIAGSLLEAVLQK